MAKQLILAEKPSMGQNIIAAIGYEKFTRAYGYAESENHIVCWSFGHLFELQDLEDYSSTGAEDKRTWTLEGLPFCPKQFRYVLKTDSKTGKADSGIRKQFEIIKTLVHRPDVDCIVHAGDADREGEIIIRTILDMAGNRKPVFRLWLPAQTPSDIRDGLRNMKRDSQYDDLAQEGYARTYVDWLFGINLTRTASVKSGSTLRVGRVIVPIVKAIYDRDMAIRAFKPTPFITVVSEETTNGEKIKLSYKQTFAMDERQQAAALAKYLNDAQAVVTDIKTEEKRISAGKLLNQSSLQARAGKLYQFSPQETLDLAQKLYEKGYISYPRTASEYLATSEQGKTNRILKLLLAQGYQVAPKDGRKTIYDDNKVESHSAITPTTRLPEPGAFNANEQKIYNIILNRFLAVFCSESCIVDHTVMTISVDDTDFRLSGDVFRQRGWMQYDDTGRSDKILPKLNLGDRINIHFSLIERKTTPPAHYTVETLGKYLQNPFKKEKETSDFDAEPEWVLEDDLPNDDADYRQLLSGLEIGTEATRAGIIRKAIDSKYIALSNNRYTILPGGIYYIETLWNMGIKIDKFRTAKLGQALKKVYHRECSIDDCVQDAMADIRAFHNSAIAATVAKESGPSATNGVLCSCPICHGDIREGKSAYYCVNYKTCGFPGLPKQTCFVTITPRDAIALLKGAQVTKSSKTKTGLKISKKLRYDAEARKIVDMSNAPMTTGRAKRGEDAPLLKCPNCGSSIVERPSSFSCTNEQCRFALWKQTRYFQNTLQITSSKAKALLSGKPALFHLVSKTGKEYDGYLKLKANGKYPTFESAGFSKSKK